MVLSTVYPPQRDGQSERQHRSLEQILHCFVSPCQTDWGLLLPCVEFALNLTYSSAAGHSPAFILYGCKPILPLEEYSAAVRNVVDCKVPTVSEFLACMQEVAASVRTVLQNTADQMVSTVNKHQHPSAVIVGSNVWLSTVHLKLLAGLTRKFSPHFVGPFPIIEAVTPISFQLTLPQEWQIRPVFYVSQLKLTVDSSLKGLGTTQIYNPGPDELGEFEVTDILDFCMIYGGQHEFLVHWKGYSIFEYTWELQSYLANVPDTLSDFCHHRNLPFRAAAS